VKFNEFDFWYPTMRVQHLDQRVVSCQADNDRYVINMATNIPRARNVIAPAAAATSLCLYVTYRNHDSRVISSHDEIISNTLCSITPTPTSSIHKSLSDQHIYNLTKYGATVVKDTLSHSQLDTWRARTKAQFDSGENIEFNQGRAYYSVSKRLGSISKKSKYYSDMARIGYSSSSCDIDDSSSEDTSTNNTSWFGGLWKRRKRNSSSMIEDGTTATKHTSISLQDVVRAYFKENGITHYELTDVQFLNAYPYSTNQIWHRDNKFKGLTAIVALQDIRQNGPTELIVGSHATSFSLWNAIKQRESSLLLGCINAGDTILYDARIFHRGRGNNMKEEDRPVLVLRWDNAKTPPPGMGMIVTMANTYIGCWYYAVLSALQKISPQVSNDKDKHRQVSNDKN